jgi:hypothetical protein
VLGLALLAGGCADYAPANRIVYAEGTTVHLARLEGDSLVEITSASLPPQGLLGGHTIFGLMKHPRKPWLYVSSFNECGQDDNWCWGNARIDLFEVGGSELAHLGPVFVYDATVAVVARCAAVDFGYPGQVGACAPVNGSFSADGSRLYVQDDDYDVLDIFAVGEDGVLSILWEGGEDEMRLHGVARHPTLPYVYNGSTVLDVTGDQTSTVISGQGGNDTALAGGGLLVTTLETSTVALFSLADPAAPLRVDSVVLSSNEVRSVDIDGARGRLVAVGRDRVTTFTFDGADLAEADVLTYDGPSPMEFRSVAMLEGGDRAAAAWFMASAGSPGGYLGGVTLFGIAADGTLTAGNTLLVPRAARALITLGR